ncbi:hypothetical protein SLS62_008501 [Diatrype stigma]|uniref:Myb-like domain-containing protein n=1 Tax=Diatrype stigma TaxID=117547 RepID=A0AAN9YLY3_9PEZI
MTYVPTSDVLDRHDYGITKHRKTASTGGGRAWSEDEEVYLLQTRLQKMPYKHIASHLKKTELACRLHYHQLSHGSNRRKRTTSMSSGSSAGHSPILPVAAAPSPILEASASASASRDITPPGSAGGYDESCDAPSDPQTTHHYHHHQQQPSAIQLPSIMGHAGSTSSSSHLPAILPKPSSMQTAAAPMSASASSSGYPPTPLAENNSHYRNLAPSPFPQASSSSSSSSSSSPMHLRLDCSLPPPAATAAHVDVARLQAIYAQHRASFWSVLAAEYGAGVSPVVLEQAWKASMGVGGGGHHTPITPVTSPDDRETTGLMMTNPYEKSSSSSSSSSSDKTRISAILGIDANPRSPKEREIVRRLEEGRSSVGVVVGA